MRLLLCCLCLATVARGADVDEFIKDVRTALRKGDADAALAAAEKAVAVDPKSAVAVYWRGEAKAAKRDPEGAIKDFDAALALDPTYLIARNQRGGEQFKLGKIDESIADFDAFLKAYPKEEPGHWRRGISFYYAGKYAEGAKQFLDGRAVFGSDVENVFFHYICVARKDGEKKARESLIPLDGPDGRVPMMAINEMLHGKKKPAEVIAVAEGSKLEGGAKTEALFYGNLYVGLYLEVSGDAAGAEKHLAAAVEHKIGHYMWDVANVHLKRLRKK